MEALVADMVQDDPTKRPTIDEAVARLDSIIQGLSGWKLRSRVVRRKDFWMCGPIRGCAHWYRRIGFIARQVPAVPAPDNMVLLD